MRAPADRAATPLPRVAAASKPPAAQGLPGFHLSTCDEYAFNARAALAEAARRLIDARCGHVHNDTAAVALLGGLREAKPSNC